MISKATRILALIAILEGVVIIGMAVHRTHFVVKTQNSPVRQEPSPLTLALDYDAPDTKFQEVVKQHLAWLPYHAYGDPTSILAKCADRKRTNYVRILIENGADVEKAVKELKDLNQEEAVNLLNQVQSQVKQTGTNSIAPSGNH